MSNPAAVAYLGGYDLPEAAQDVEVVGSVVYAADIGGVLHVLDVSNPAGVNLLGEYDTPAAAWDVEVVGNMAYLADGDYGLQILDVSNPAVITFAGEYDTSGVINGIEMANGEVYVADGGGGLQILDVSNPAAVTRRGWQAALGKAYGVDVVGDFAYVADYVAGLQIIHVSDPSAAVVVGGYDGFTHGYDVKAIGNLAYVAAGTSGLHILDVSDPASVTRLGGYATSGHAYDVQVVGNLAYVTGSMGLEILNVSDVAAATYLGGDQRGYMDVDVVGDLAYVTDYSLGVYILDVSNPTAVTQLARVDTSGNAYDVEVLGSALYVADEQGGLSIHETGLPATGISHLSGNTYRVHFGQPVPESEYALLLGPGIRNTAGFWMDQDQDDADHELPEDAYFARFVVGGLDGADSVAVSPDGKHVYVAGYDEAAVAVFSRYETTGEVTFVEALKDGQGGVDGLYGVATVIVSPDGGHVYAAAFGDDSLAVLERNPVTGELTYLERHVDGVSGVDGLFEPYDVA